MSEGDRIFADARGNWRRVPGTADAIPDLTTLEREVVEKAEAWACTEAEFAGVAGATLLDAVRALQSARKPKGVKPSEVAPGTRFRFATASPIGPVFVLGRDALGFYYIDIDSRTRSNFSPEDLILPLDPQEPDA